MSVPTGPACAPEPGRRRGRGFTLVEVLAALVVGGMVAAAVTAGVRALTTWTSASRERAREANRAGARRAQIAEWLAAAAPPAGARDARLRFRSRSTPDGRADDELSWPTLARSAFSSGRTRVRLYVDRDPATPERGLVAELSEGGSLGLRRVELAPKVDAMEVRFSASGGAWTSDWGSVRQLPRAVELRLDGDSVPRVLRAPIVVTWRGP